MRAPRAKATSSRRRFTNGRVAVGVALVSLLLGGALAAGLLAGDPGSKAGDKASPWPVLSLSSSFVTQAGSWAILPMGDLNDPHNTFWQVFFRPAGEAHWLLVTPPGVGANGGFSAAVGHGGDVTVAFDPTNLLTFSPFATTSDNGSKWTGGVIPFGIAPVPDALAPATSTTGRLSALSSGRAEVETGTGGDAQWTNAYSEKALARSTAGHACGVGMLTSLAGIGSDQMVGSTCATPGVVGIFRAPVGESGGWTLVGPTLHAGATRFDVLRLSVTGGRVVALVDAVKDSATGQANNAANGSVDNLYGIWDDSQSSGWSVSAPLAISAHSRIVSSGFGVGGSLVVETESSSGALSASVLTPAAGAGGGAGAAATWRQLPRLPAHTESVSLGTPTAALSVVQTSLTEWRLENDSWVRAQQINVPIQFGSSG